MICRQVSRAPGQLPTSRAAVNNQASRTSPHPPAAGQPPQGRPSANKQASTGAGQPPTSRPAPGQASRQQAGQHRGRPAPGQASTGAGQHRGRPPARGGPTIYDGSTSHATMRSIVGPPLAGGLSHAGGLSMRVACPCGWPAPESLHLGWPGDWPTRAAAASYGSPTGLILD